MVPEKVFRRPFWEKDTKTKNLISNLLHYLFIRSVLASLSSLSVSLSVSTNVILGSFPDCLLVISNTVSLFTGRLLYVGIFDLLLVTRNLHPPTYPSLLLTSSSATATLHR